MSHFYKILGHKVKSDFVIKSAVHYEGKDFDFSLKETKTAVQESDIDWYHTIEEGGKEWVYLGKTKSSYVARIVDCGDLYFSDKGHTVTFFNQHQIQNSDVEALLLNQGLVFALQMQGHLVLHASGLSYQDEALLFLGPHKAGKSSLIAYLHQEGYKVLSDDAIPITFQDKKILALQGIPEIRLESENTSYFFKDNELENSESVFYKKRIALNKESRANSLPIRAVFFLNPDQANIKIEPLSSDKAIPLYLSQSMRLKIDDTKLLEKEFLLLSQVMQSVPAYLLSYPKGYEHLDEIWAVIGHLLANE